MVQSTPNGIAEVCIQCFSYHCYLWTRQWRTTSCTYCSWRRSPSYIFIEPTINEWPWYSVRFLVWVSVFCTAACDAKTTAYSPVFFQHELKTSQAVTNNVYSSAIFICDVSLGIVQAVPKANVYIDITIYRTFKREANEIQLYCWDCELKVLGN